MFTYSKVINIRHNVDVLVVGGGPSGVVAAVACARQGKSVFLVESQGSFGGAGTTGLVPAFMQFTDGENFLCGGIGREIYNEVSKADCYKYGRSINAEMLKRLYDNMIEESGIGFSFFTTLIDVVCDTNGHVDYALFSAKSGIFAIKAKVYIDCTGDGDLAAYAGAKFDMGNDDGICMPATLCSHWCDINWAKKSFHDREKIEEACDNGIFTNYDLHLPGMWRVGESEGGGNIGHCFELDATDERSLTKAMIWGRRVILEYEKYYKTYLNGYENMNLTATAPVMGVRESRRITCDYTLNKKDYAKRAVFTDEIGRYSYPIDIHVMTPSKDAYDKFESTYANQYSSGESYGIPYSMLTVKGFDNILVAGRCISTDREMQASIRVMPGCYITGQAAGIAAALACEAGGDIRVPQIKTIQKRLVDIGGYLPNFGGKI